MGTTEFTVGNYRVDMSRSQIIAQDDIMSMEPKVLQVLLVLAEHQGKVVTHEILLQQVWPNVEVAPNALQRCIAQLRKAFNDDAKSQRFIATHPKVGYSLVANVSWQEELESSQLQSRLSSKAMYMGVLSICSLIVLSIAVLWNSTKSQLEYSSLRPLTASDEKEFNPNYSPDGRYLVFHRYLGMCKNHIWAKDLKTQAEIRLTAAPGIYGPHSWSVDGNQLTFAVQENCRQLTKHQDICWRLNTLDFSEALKDPQKPVQRLDCDSNRISTPKWLSDGQIVLLKTIEGSVRLIRFDPRSNESIELYDSPGREIYSAEVDNQNQRIVLVSVSNDNQHWMEQIDFSGHKVTEVMLKTPPELSYYEYYYPNLHPNTDYMLVDTINGLYGIRYDGSFEKVITPTINDMYTPYFHPNQQKVVVTLGNVDFDIAQIDLDDYSTQEVKEGFNQAFQPYPSFQRSNSYDSEARFRPQDDGIAFVSSRSGEKQVWYFDGRHSKQLTSYKHNYRMSGLSWSPDGNRLAFIANDRITLLSLNGDQVQLTSDLVFYDLIQWINEDQLLLIARYLGEYTPFIYHIKQQREQMLPIKDVKWAYQLDSGDLVYVDNADKVWRLKKGSNEILNFYNDQLNAKKYASYEGKIYGINKQDQLWQLDLNSNKFVILRELHSQVTWLSDIKDNQLLLTQTISAKKEVVELSAP